MTATQPQPAYRKAAPAEVDVHELIRERWSPRAFADTPVPATLQEQLFEAARWAPSSMNEQPWRFIVADRARDAAAHARLAATLAPFNAGWAGRAPLLLLVLAKDEFSRGGENRWAQYDTGLAVAQLTLQATELGLSLHQIGGFDPQAAQQALGIPGGYTPIAVIAIGYAASPETLGPQLAARETAPRTRLALHEWVHAGAWGKAWDAHAAVL